MVSEETRANQLQDILSNIPGGVPIIMVNMLRFREIAEYSDGRKNISGREAYDIYRAEASKLLAKVGGGLAWLGDVQGSVIGPPDESWDQIFHVRYPSIEKFMEMITSAAYRDAAVHRTAALLDSRLIATIERS